MGKRKVGALEKVDADLSNLQHKIRRDPISYAGDFQKQYRQYESYREIFLAAPSSADNNGVVTLRELIEFVAHVADCYPDTTKEFPNHLIEILSLYHHDLEPELREKIVGSLVLLRKKQIISSIQLLQNLFPILISTKSKSLRALLFTKVLSDLRSSNAKTKNHKLNRAIQTVLFNLLTSDRTSSKGLWAIKITRELWKRQIWTDGKSVDLMKEAALADNEKVTIGGVRFLLGGDTEREELQDESSEDDDQIDMGKLRHQAGFSKKTKKKSRTLEKAAATVKKRERKKNAPQPLNFSALHLLHDPQGFAEALFLKHLQSSKSKLTLEHKLQVLQLVSRLIGLHKLTVISFYSYFLKYLTPRQSSVTSFLASLAQSTHNLVPPDVLEPIVQKIANEFVSEAAASEVASAGLNAIREICVRQPLAMNSTLLQDLVMYKKSKDKGVMTAARGLQNLYREEGAEMLKKRDRGKGAALGLRKGENRQGRFGEEQVGQIEGLELLERWKEEEKQRKLQVHGESGLQGNRLTITDEDEAENSAAWEVEAEESDDSGGWIDLESDGENERRSDENNASEGGEDIDVSEDEDEDDSDVMNEDQQDESASVSDGDDSGEIEIELPPTKRIKVDVPEKGVLNDDKENHQMRDSTDAPKDPNYLATTRILTPADLAKLRELRTTSSINSLLPAHQKHHNRLTTQPLTNSHRHIDDPLTSVEIEGLASLSAGRASREAKLAHLAEMKTDRTEHKSKAARKKERKADQGKSTTNKEKERKKNFLMTLAKGKRKGKRSLVEKGKVLKAHKERGKKGGRRGNR
ncbi:MAG: hypothetical protein Q9160_000503 [Pyrenula sp. 1 TL-2023]